MVMPSLVRSLARPLKYISYSLFFILALMYFTPKVALFYLLENKLNPYGVIIGNEKVKDNGFSLILSDANIYVKGIKSLSLSQTNIKIFGVYNSVNISGIKLSVAAASLTPINIKKINIRYSIFNPLNIIANADGEFGKIKASFHILDFKLHLELEASPIMKKDFGSTLNNLKKLKTGVYSYDKTFKL